MPRFSFITTHGLVLLAIAQRPQSTARNIGDAAGITERATHRIIKDLEAAGYISKTKVGRHNAYRIHPDKRLEDSARVTVKELLTLLGWRPEGRQSKLPISGENGGQKQR
jgi:hypothetical protein